MEGGAVLVMGKGRRERLMPLGDAARSALLYYLQEEEKLPPATNALWISEQKRALLPGGVFLILKHQGKRAGIPNLHTHRFHQSYTVNALRAGMSVKSATDSRRLEEDSGYLLQDTWSRGCDAVSPPGESRVPAGVGIIVARGSAAREAVTGGRPVV